MAITNRIMGEQLLTTSAAHLAPEDLPAQPLAYCAYDIVVLAPGALAAMSERQTQVLCRWVCAGGSLCVFAGRENTAEQCQSLNAVAGIPDQYRPDGRGTTDDLARFHLGLGRSVIVTGAFDPAVAADSAAWRKVVCFLWKLRPRVADAIVRDGCTDFLQLKDAQTGPGASAGMKRAALPPGTDNRLPVSFAVQTSVNGYNVMNCLFPKDMRMLPFSAIIGILLLYVLLIGPLDWWVLGWFRRRRYTWVLFPVVTVLVAAATVALANRYMGQQDRRHALVVVDLDSHGAVLRQDRMELAISGRNQILVTDVRHALWSRLAAGSGYNGFGYGRVTETESPRLEGALPLQFRVATATQQWEPQMSRTFSMEPGTVALPFDLAAVNQVLRTGETKGLKMPEKMRWVLFQKNSYKEQDHALARAAQSGTRTRNNNQAMPADSLASIPVRPISQSEKQGIFELVTQLSPTGGANLEDLFLMGEPGGRGALFVALGRAGDDIVMYRRVEYGE